MTKTDIEALMRPRYKVIADYPLNKHFKLGNIILLDQLDERVHLKKKEPFAIVEDFKGNSLPIAFYQSEFDQYKNIFKPLAWWEERESSEMPEYLKAESGNIFKVQKWESDSVFFTNGEHWYITPNVFCFFEPATQEDYLQYINNQNKK